MLIHDPEVATCRLFEIKHMTERDDSQLRHLLDSDKIAYAARNYGQILSRTVLYRGPDQDVSSGVGYGDAGAYLNALPNMVSKKGGLM